MIKKTSQKSFLLALMILLACLDWQGTGMAATESYTFGVVPQQSASNLFRSWIPLIAYLSKKSGVTLHIKSARDIPAYEYNLKTHRYNFAYMNPYHYVNFHKQGYRAFAKEKDRHLVGIIVVRKDSDITSLTGLAGHKLAFPSPLAFAASMLTRAELKKLHIPFIPRYVESHDSVYLNVVDRNFIAGGGVIRTFKALNETARNQLRILYKTKGYTSHAFAADSTVPEKVVKAVQAAMLSLANEEAGKALLAKLKMHGFMQASDRDWDDIRQLQLMK